MQYVKEVIVVSPRRVQILFIDGRTIAFVINRKGEFALSSKTGFIEKPAYQEACQVAGKKFAEMKKQQKPIAA